jgi:hypothetical protein
MEVDPQPLLGANGARDPHIGPGGVMPSVKEPSDLISLHEPLLVSTRTTRSTREVAVPAGAKVAS